MICLVCHTENPPGAKFCNQCGTPFARVCAVCGSTNPPGAKFCNQCGSPLVAQPDGASAARTPAVPDATSDGSSATSTPAASKSRQASTKRRTANGRAARRTAPATASVPTEAPSALASAPAAPEHPADIEPHAHEEQRRVVTVLFADLTSSTAIADALDAEDARDLLAGFFAEMTRQIHRHGGTVEKYIGDAVMAVFGLPTVHEDDPMRAVRAALDMQAGLRHYNERRSALSPSTPALQMRIGINTGEVVAASGSAEGRDFLITGDPVNVAARLQQIAMPGSIVVGARTYRGTSGAVVYKQLPNVAVKGKSRPLRVWEAQALVEQGTPAAQRPRGVGGLQAPIIGRDVELSLLRSLYARVSGERRPHLVTLLGVPGVGKTRLAREFCARVASAARAPDGVGAGASSAAHPVPRSRPADPSSSGDEQTSGVLEHPLVLEGRCPQYGEAITYWPLAEMLRALCDFTAMTPREEARARLLACVRSVLSTAGRPEDPEQLAAYLGYTIGIQTLDQATSPLPTDLRQLQDVLPRAWRMFFEALAAQRPVLLVVDDIHWADDVLLDMLEYIATRASDVPLMLICPARPELLERRPAWGGGKRNYALINLEPLSPADADRLVRELLPGDGVPESLRYDIQLKAEGNPFYFEEIIRMLVDRGMLIPDEGRAGGWRLASGRESSAELEDLDIPDTVQGVLAARLDLLDTHERDVLQHAAVIGRYFWPSALIALHPGLDGTLDATLAALQTKDLIHEVAQPEASVAPTDEPLYSFSHALTRDVTYAGIPRHRRAMEHQQVAEWLEALAQGRQAEFADLIAQHYRQYYLQVGLDRSGQTEQRQAVRDKVVSFLTLAGDQAHTRHAAAKAERYFTDALTLLEADALSEDVPHIVRLYMKRGAARWAQVRADDAWADYREALRLWSAYSAFLVDGLSSGGAAAEDAWAAVRADGELAVVSKLPHDEQFAPALPVDWRSWGLWLYRLLVLLPTRSTGFFQHPPSHEELLPYLMEGLRLAEELGQRETREGAALLTAKAFFWWSWGEQRTERELLDALKAAREAVRIAEALDAPHRASEALDALGNLQAITADLKGALESQERRLQWAQRIEDLPELVDIASEVCTAHMLIGEFAEAVEHGTRALTLATEADADVLRARALRCLVLAYAEWEHWPEAIQAGESFQRALTYPGAWQSTQNRWSLLAIAIAYARTGDREAADRLARKINLVADRDEIQYIELFKARFALARGAIKEARQTLLGAVDARIGRQMLPMLLAELAELAARSGDHELFERFNPQALELGWRSGARKAHAQALRARGLAAMDEGRYDDAQCDLEGALDRFHELGAAWEEARTRYALAGLFMRRGTQDDAARAHNELTAALDAFERLHTERDAARALAALAGGSAARVP
jgi:class 3 adenylate cyclase/tetratricopeptide (TPR) repeat protein/ribosomal protein L40E